MASCTCPEASSTKPIKVSAYSPPNFLNNIAITYVNKTRLNDFTLVVFAKTYDVECPPIAWHAIRTQSSAEFVYPVDTGVVAYWTSSDVKYKSGPETSKMRMVWDVYMSSKDDAATIKPAVQEQTDPYSFMLKNVKPIAWDGQPLNMGIHKGANLFMVEEDVGVNGFAKFTLSSMLTFGVQTKTLSRDDIFDLVKDLECEYELDLNDYSNGVIMELGIYGGDFKFKAKETWQPAP